jgi:hypothetical protein
MAWLERFGDAAKPPGPGVWHRDREHGRVPDDLISDYMGSDEHRATSLVQQRFGDGDTRGWGHWRPEGHIPAPKTFVAPPAGGGGHGQSEVVGGIHWYQGGRWAKQPPLGLCKDTTVEALLPLLSSVAAGHTVFELRPWRRELAEWEERQKPAALAVHRRLQAVNTAALDDAQLWVRGELASLQPPEDAAPPHIACASVHLLIWLRGGCLWRCGAGWRPAG